MSSTTGTKLTPRMVKAITDAVGDAAMQAHARITEEEVVLQIFTFVANGHFQIRKTVCLHFTSINGVLHVSYTTMVKNADGESNFKSVDYKLTELLDMYVSIMERANDVPREARADIERITSAVNINYLKEGDDNAAE